jgi:hypothetical protein
MGASNDLQKIGIMIFYDFLITPVLACTKQGQKSVCVKVDKNLIMSQTIKKWENDVPNFQIDSL